MVSTSVPNRGDDDGIDLLTFNDDVLPDGVLNRKTRQRGCFGRRYVQYAAIVKLTTVDEDVDTTMASSRSDVDRRLDPDCYNAIIPAS